jgi:ubiquinone/menaquinone biosynthesis C-methylase UbiE
MKNPWLQIPACDYEARMALPEVAQTQALSKLMASVLKEYTPESLAVIGCTTGSGFEHIDHTHNTHRVVGVDINAAYLAVLKARFAGKIPRLELIEADITAPDFEFAPVSMVFAALVFEYVNVAVALCNIARCLASGAILVAVLQLPSPESAPVTATPYKSLKLLAPIMNLVSPSEFSRMCNSLGLQQVKTDSILLKKGKAFFVGFYRKDAEPGVPPDRLRSR